ncbi:MAG: Amuc_1102 family pilus-like protein [Roseimicrobium sp.]
MTIDRFFCVAALYGMALASPASAQEVSKEVKVDVKKVEIGAQNTPQFTASNVKDKRWNPKVWLEVDVGFGLKKARVTGQNSPMVDSLDFKFYVVLNKTDKAGKRIMLTASVTYLNASEDDRESHAMVFASPAALARVLENPRFTAADITPVAYAVEVYKGGALAGGASSGAAGKWWESDTVSAMDGVLLPKVKTPFAPLWGDYDLETK